MLRKFYQSRGNAGRLFARWGTDPEAMRRFVGIDRGLQRTGAVAMGGADEVERMTSRHRLLMTIALAAGHKTSKRPAALRASSNARVLARQAQALRCPAG